MPTNAKFQLAGSILVKNTEIDSLRFILIQVKQGDGNPDTLQLPDLISEAVLVLFTA